LASGQGAPWPISWPTTIAPASHADRWRDARYPAERKVLHVAAIPVYPSYFQFDQQGVVFNMWYFAWFDDAMTQFLGEAGYSYQTMIAHGLDVQLVHTEADWRTGVRYGESVLIDVVTESMGSTSFTLSFTVRAGSTVRSTARTVYVVVGTDGSGKQPIPPKLRAALQSAR
jgi:acyl-CoA thioester hydrolase